MESDILINNEFKTVKINAQKTAYKKLLVG